MPSMDEGTATNSGPLVMQSKPPPFVVAANGASARKSTCPGGRAYGYIPDSQSGTGQIEINEQQAQIVRQIFELRAAGWSGKRITQR
jgi:hypothetical protein